MRVKIKKLVTEATIPTYAKPNDAGMDLTATSFEIDKHGNYSYGTGLAMAIPVGYVGLLFPRSSVTKTDLILKNCVGVIDSDYRGEVIFKFRAERIGTLRNATETEVTYSKIVYKIGERIGQIIIIPRPEIEFDEVEELSSTERGEGGFGLTGK